MALKVGIQLYSVRELMKQDPIKTIYQVADAGYKYLEAANHNALEDQGIGFGVSAEELKKVLDDAGAKVVSAHIYPFNMENYKKVIEYNQKIGNTTVIYPMEYFSSRDDVMRKVEMYEQMGKIAAEEGMTFLYHNHYHEFQEFDGETVMDAIVNNTDPEHVNLELDTYWTLRGGVDPVEAMKHFGTRIKKLHQKDLVKDSKNPVNMFDIVGKDTIIDQKLWVGTKCNDDFTEIGYGCMDIQSIIDTANKIGTYGLAVLTHYHHIPFYVAAPVSTIDWALAQGSLIEIEQRDPSEVLAQPIPGVDLYNPAFDVTPGNLVTAFITDKGIASPEKLDLLKCPE